MQGLNTVKSGLWSPIKIGMLVQRNFSFIIIQPYWIQYDESLMWNNIEGGMLLTAKDLYSLGHLTFYE